MYHPFKRRKVELDVDQFDDPAGRYGFQKSRERARSLGQSSKKEMPNLPKIVLPPYEDQAFDVLKYSHQEVQSLHDLSENQPSELRRRQLVPTPVYNAVQPTAKPITTMVAVDISDGKNVISHAVEPMSTAGTVNVPGEGRGRLMSPIPPLLRPMRQIPPVLPISTTLFLARSSPGSCSSIVSKNCRTSNTRGYSK